MCLCTCVQDNILIHFEIQHHAGCGKTIFWILIKIIKNDMNTILVFILFLKLHQNNSFARLSSWLEDFKTLIIYIIFKTDQDIINYMPKRDIGIFKKYFLIIY